MRRSRPVRIALTAALTIAIGMLALTSTALAYRRADRSEVRAVTRALARRPGDCGARRVTRLHAVVISTADPRYAGAACVTHFYDIMRRPSARSERWTVALEIGDNPPECSAVVRHVPRGVIHDLHIGGFRGNRLVSYC